MMVEEGRKVVKEELIKVEGGKRWRGMMVEERLMKGRRMTEEEWMTEEE